MKKILLSSLAVLALSAMALYAQEGGFSQGIFDGKRMPGWKKGSAWEIGVFGGTNLQDQALKLDGGALGARLSVPVGYGFSTELNFAIMMAGHKTVALGPGPMYKMGAMMAPTQLSRDDGGTQYLMPILLAWRHPPLNIPFELSLKLGITAAKSVTGSKLYATGTQVIDTGSPCRSD
ncbi:MAG: hypothetical protein AABZ44_01295, partial [Elusimicrobiota bacterium]